MLEHGASAKGAIMISITNRDEYASSVIAQADSGGYDPSGYVAVVKDGQAALSSFGHCSCYGTWEALCGGGISDYFQEGQPDWDWTGTVDELVAMAREGLDPDLPQRKIGASDYNSGYLTDVYRQILEWNEQRSK